MESTDWELGMPPQMVELDAYVLGYVRRGWRRGSWFIFVDCTHPQQNTVIDVNRIDAWRARDTLKVIEYPEYGRYASDYPPASALATGFGCLGNASTSALYGASSSIFDGLFGKF